MERHAHWKAWFECILSITLLIFFCIFYVKSYDWTIQTLPTFTHPAFFPSLIAGCMILLCLIYVTITTKELYRKIIKKGYFELEKEKEKDTINIMLLSAYIAAMFSYVIGLHFLGFLVSTPIAMITISYILGLRKIIYGIISYTIFSFILYYLVLNFLQIILPQGVIFS